MSCTVEAMGVQSRHRRRSSALLRWGAALGCVGMLGVAITAGTPEAAPVAQQLPLGRTGEERVVVFGNSVAASLAQGLRSMAWQHSALAEVVQDTTAGIASYADTALFDWRSTYSKIVDDFDPQVAVLYPSLSTFSGCDWLLSGSDKLACVEHARAHGIFPVVDDMLEFFTERGVVVIWMGYLARASVTGPPVHVGEARRTNEALDDLNTAIAARVESAGHVFIDPGDVFGDSYQAFYRDGDGWRQWRYTSDWVHLCPRGVAKLLELVHPVLFSESRFDADSPHFNQGWDSDLGERPDGQGPRCSTDVFDTPPDEAVFGAPVQ